MDLDVYCGYRFSFNFTNVVDPSDIPIWGNFAVLFIY